MPLCKNPYMAGTVPCPCGKCMPCLINRKRLWTHRIMLESFAHDYCSFITLTYDDDHLLYYNSVTGSFSDLPTLDPAHLKNFLKRIRRSVAPRKLRYYAVGEYGDKSWRPHYHIALFGYEPCWRGETRKDYHSKGRSCCLPCDLLKEKWPYGGVDNARVEAASAGYIAGYVTKKLTKADDQRLQGRYPEFSRMSRKPGLGAIDIDKVADALFSRFGKDALTEHGDVPLSLHYQGRSMPLGRYLREKLREEIGANDVPKEMAKAEYIQELLTMWKDHLNDPSIPKEKKLSLKHYIQQRDKQKILNIETKHNLKRKDKML